MLADIRFIAESVTIFDNPKCTRRCFASSCFISARYSSNRKCMSAWSFIPAMQSTWSADQLQSRRGCNPRLTLASAPPHPLTHRCPLPSVVSCGRRRCSSCSASAPIRPRNARTCACPWSQHALRSAGGSKPLSSVHHLPRDGLVEGLVTAVTERVV